MKLVDEALHALKSQKPLLMRFAQVLADESAVDIDLVPLDDRIGTRVELGWFNDSHAVILTEPLCVVILLRIVVSRLCEVVRQISEVMKLLFNVMNELRRIMNLLPRTTHPLRASTNPLSMTEKESLASDTASPKSFQINAGGRISLRLTDR